ncbi:ABC transporter permease subunit [Microbacterium schleiferi]|uniref:ABC transporter permease subunit n=1 Tax=Microbacterium schleiferi TaxID=69362 RepID=A0A7S8MVC5_9MICO|nr:ABC transporter permease subunit [Microbacterium schleiferi]QPE03905.1 ABC transporter permease subunit [Microbacterium schleiferi]
MTDIAIIAAKEFRERRRDPLLIGLIAFLGIACVVSVTVASGAFRVELDAYNAYVEQLTASGSQTAAAAPRLFPMQLLRGAVEYVELLGALFAIVVGYGSIAAEKRRGTLDLVLSRPVGLFSLGLGKVAGLSAVWAVVLVALAIIEAIALLTIGGASLGGYELRNILLATVVLWLYLVFWTAVAIAVTSLTARPSTGLIIAVALWLVVVLILPQIGDTMDPDNQVPGGLFAALQIQRPDELTVMAHFAGFDGIRNGIEVSSITKHTERLSFAFLGIKDQYNQQPLGAVWADMWPYALTLFSATIAAVSLAAVTTTRGTLQRKTS